MILIDLAGITVASIAVGYSFSLIKRTQGTFRTFWTVIFIITILFLIEYLTNILSNILLFPSEIVVEIMQLVVIIALLIGICKINHEIKIVANKTKIKRIK